MPSLSVDRAIYLELNTVALACPAWHVTNIEVLFDDMAVRGGDRILPGATGRRPFKRIIDASVFTLALEVWGNKEVDGTNIADPAVGLLQHIAYLKANLGLGYAVGDGTVPAIFHRSSEAPYYADVHFLGFQGSQLTAPAYYRTTFDISVPYGWSLTP